MSPLSRLRRIVSAPAAAPQPEPRKPRPPTPGQVRRERKALARAREERIRDLGGLLLDMYKRDSLKPELFYEQCAEIIGIEERVQELDAALATLTRRNLADANRCACGAPLARGAHFCANCGRPVDDEAVVVCASCGHALAADASFCANCGRPAEAAQPGETGSAQEATMIGEAGGAASHPADR